MISSLNKNECVGCGACTQICPTSCINIEEDDEGFLYPSIDSSACIACNACERTCPVISTVSEPIEELPQAFLAWTTQESDLKAATSGGAFLALARQVLKEGGVVVGAAYDDNLVVRHIVVKTQDELLRITRSKYVQSDTRLIFPQVANLLKEGITVLFSGTTCQVYAMSAYCHANNINDEKLLLVDVVCLGVPTPKLLREYLSWQQEKEASGIRSVSMRERRGRSMFGSGTFMRIDYENGKIRTVPMDLDPYGRFFWSGLSSRPSCHCCPFKTLERLSDLTLGDCWFSRQLSRDSSVPFNVTLCLTHSERGRRLLENCGNLFLHNVDTIRAIKANGGMLYTSSNPHPKRKAFLKRLGKERLDVLSREYLPSGLTFTLWGIRRRIGNALRVLLPLQLEKRSRPRQDREFERRLQRTICPEAFARRTFNHQDSNNHLVGGTDELRSPIDGE